MYSHLLITFATGHGTLHVSTDLVAAGDAQLRHRIDDALEAGCTRLDVDCGHVRHVEQSSLGTLAAAKEHVEARGGSLVITRRSPAFTRAAELVGLHDLLLDPPSGGHARSDHDGRTRA